MGFEHTPNCGSLFPNERKEKDTQPDFTGDGLIEIANEQRKVKLAAWKKKTKAGRPMLSIKFEDPEERAKEVEKEVFDF